MPNDAPTIAATVTPHAGRGSAPMPSLPAPCQPTELPWSALVPRPVAGLPLASHGAAGRAGATRSTGGAAGGGVRLGFLHPLVTDGLLCGDGVHVAFTLGLIEPWPRSVRVVGNG